MTALTSKASLCIACAPPIPTPSAPPRRTRALHKLAKFIKQQGPAGGAAGGAAAAEPSQHHHLVQVLLDVAVPLLQQVSRPTTQHRLLAVLLAHTCLPACLSVHYHEARPAVIAYLLLTRPC